MIEYTPTVLQKEDTDSLRVKDPPLLAAWSEKQTLDFLHPFGTKPHAPRRGKTLLTLFDHFSREQAPRSGLQYLFSGEASNLKGSRNLQGIFRQHVVKVRYAALNGGRHAHVV